MFFDAFEEEFDLPAKPLQTEDIIRRKVFGRQIRNQDGPVT